MSSRRLIRSDERPPRAPYQLEFPVSDSWDKPFPLPSSGDDNERLTFDGVGRAITAWESVEFELSRLYSIFAGDPDGSAIQEYGRGQIFRERLKSLKEAGERAFIRRPDQGLEDIMGCLGGTAQGYSNRRNEVAHGIVFLVSSLTFFRVRFCTAAGECSWALIPTYYNIRKHNNDGAPTYAYTSTELRALTGMLYELLDKIKGFRITLFARGYGLP